MPAEGAHRDGGRWYVDRWPPAGRVVDLVEGNVESYDIKANDKLRMTDLTQMRMISSTKSISTS